MRKTRIFSKSPHHWLEHPADRSLILIKTLHKSLTADICVLHIYICVAQVSVQVLEKGFIINVFMDRSRPGLLAAILEAFDELGLTVLDARASCSSSFRLEAGGGEVRYDLSSLL